jgi:hypothetical protein
MKIFSTRIPIFSLFCRPRLFYSIFFFIALLLKGIGLSHADDALADSFQERSPYRIETQRWREAEKIFRSDSHWLGGDGASSIDMGHGRALWLFGDSFIDLSGSGIRRVSDLVHNSIAIQTGYNPVEAEMKFFWKKKGNKPTSFFSRPGDHWYWPSSGILVGRHLLVFLMEIEAAKNPLGFEVCGWKAVLIHDLKKTPEQWILTYLKSPQKIGYIIGCGSPVLKDGFLQVFATDFRDRAVYLVRWPERSAATGTLLKPQWWAGDKVGWIGAETPGVEPEKIIAKGQMEFSVEYRPQLKRYLQIQTLSLINPCLAVSSAESLTGPWSSQDCFFNPPEQDIPGTLIYAGKSHPMLRGAEMVFTYVVNANKEDIILRDLSLYFPIMLKGTIEGGIIPREE